MWLSTLGGAFAQVVFQLTVTRSLIITGIVWACVIGLLGDFFPALRAARLPGAEALRAT
jgi:putative ABC transport system permease protein